MENVLRGKEQAELSLKFAQDLTQNASLALETISTFKKQWTELRGAMARAVANAHRTHEDAVEANKLALAELSGVNTTRLLGEDSFQAIANRVKTLNNEVNTSEKLCVEMPGFTFWFIFMLFDNLERSDSHF